MKRVILSLIIIFPILISCKNNEKIYGKYYRKVTTGEQVITIDEKVADLEILGAGPYEVKENKIYVESIAGTIILEIVDKNTLRIANGFKEGKIYKKKK